MATGTIKKFINPPDVANSVRIALTNGIRTLFTSDGAWYCVFGINEATAGSCAAYLMSADESKFYACVDCPSTKYTRSSSPWIFFPKGVQFKAQAYFTDASKSGLFKASPLP